ncbi:hypothetical protein PAMC26510_03900 [Caballeronia sordidicola]|uniref:Uncharacterized protein n=1 Tax=Caballeronia sordidicola TaxID=196367 RepID=A0A242N942_CABSO|nr:hypothetical protein PAMC26510_03900 [Caballeronia sordidicola]
MSFIYDVHCQQSATAAHGFLVVANVVASFVSTEHVAEEMLDLAKDAHVTCLACLM